MAREGGGGSPCASLPVALLRWFASLPRRFAFAVRGALRLVIVQSIHFWALLALLLAQCVYAVYFHALLCNVALANTMLLLVVLVRFSPGPMTDASSLFHRICGCVVFVAVLFMSCTHAMEMLTENFTQEDSSDSHTESHAHDEDDDHLNHQAVPLHYLYVCSADIVLKLALMSLRSLPAFGLPLVLQAVLHTLCPLVIIGLISFEEFTNVEGNWFVSHLDPLVALCLCALSIAIIIPAFYEMKPYIFADTPDCFDSSQFKRDIASHYEHVTCTHLHVFRLWPGNQFEALIHLNIKVNKSEAGWSKEAAQRFMDIKTFIRSALTKGGAAKVVIEPRFVDAERDNPEWMGCIHRSCREQDRGCCRDRTENQPLKSPVPAS